MSGSVVTAVGNMQFVLPKTCYALIEFSERFGGIADALRKSLDKRVTPHPSDWSSKHNHL